MTRWLMLAGLVPLLTGQALAAPKPITSPPRTRPATDRTVNFRLLQDTVLDTTPVHHSGMAAQTNLAPNASVGVGMISVSSRRAASGDWRNDARFPRSKKVAIKLTLKF
jgi:hypothetical protein